MNWKTLSSHLAAADKCQGRKEVAVESREAMDRYESMLTFACRRLDGARYHLGNVTRFISEEKQIADKLRQVESAGEDGVSTVRSRVLVRRERYVHELSAFLTSIKAALDHVAEATSQFLQGVTVNHSIGPIIRLADKGRKGPVYDQIVEYGEWLKEIRNYRHHLLHRMMPVLHGGYEALSIGAKTSSIRYPVTVPRKTPRFLHDTRRHRMMEDDMETPMGVGMMRTTATFTTSDGREEAIELRIRPVVMKEHQRIEVFMRRHLRSANSFVADILTAIEENEFVVIVA